MLTKIKDVYIDISKISFIGAVEGADDGCVNGSLPMVVDGEVIKVREPVEELLKIRDELVRSINNDFIPDK